MSLLMFALRDDGYSVVTDTLATEDDGAPSFFTSKAALIPHLQMVVAGTGFSFLIHEIVDLMMSRFQCRDIVMADLHLPGALAEMWAEHDGDNLPSTSTIYTLGRCEDSGAYLGFAYRSKNGFASEPLHQNGFAIKPGPAGEYSSPGDAGEYIAMAERVRSEQLERDPGDRIYIGGELFAFEASDGHVLSARLHRFNDFEDQWRDMNDRREIEDL